MENLQDLEGRLNYLFYHGNILDKEVVDNLVSNVDVIVNFAAETHVDRSILEAGSFIQTDVVGTFTLLEAAKKYQIELYIQISTDEVYGSIEEYPRTRFTVPLKRDHFTKIVHCNQIAPIPPAKRVAISW